MQKKLWLPILMILLGTNIPIIDAASSKDRSNTTMNKKKKSQSKKKTKTLQKDIFHYTPSEIEADEAMRKSQEHTRRTFPDTEETLDPSIEHIKSYQKEINQPTDYFGNRVPRLWVNDASTESPAKKYFAANT